MSGETGTPGRRERLLPGERLGRYEVLARIGGGGMGEVFSARDTELGREVAIKILPAEVAADPNRRRRFQQEARAASATHHPNLLTVHDVGRHGDIDYLVTELLRGESLRQRLARGAVTVDGALDLVIQAARGLAAAHEQGIVHRDLKPENLFVTHDGVLKILDFGIARHGGPTSDATRELDLAETREALTAAGVLVGTAGYMAPEQIVGRAVDARADLFALGCVFHELLTGHRAFDGDSVVAVLGLALTAEPPALADCGVSAPPAVEAILRRCLAKEREERWASAQELLAALERVRAELSLPAGAPLPEPTPGRRWRARGATAAVAVAAAALVVLATWGVLAGRRGTAPPAPAIDSLAVLPLVDHSRDGGDGYLADAMTDALIAELSRVRALKVISRTSVMRFKGVTRPLPEIARELGVRGVIEGFVAGDGERVRVSVTLLDAAADAPLWSADYTRPARDLLALQSEVARAIAREVRVAITPEEAGRFTASRAVDPQAHRYLLQARQLLARGDYQRDAVAEAIELSRRALDIEPGLALAHATLGTALWTSGRAGHRPMLEACRDAREAADRAFALEADLPEARLLVTRVLSSCELDWVAAERGLLELLEMVPGDAAVHDDYAWLLSNLGRHEEALEHARRAEERDPLNEQILVQRAQYLFRARRYDEAIEHLAGVLAVFPDSAFAQWCHGLVLAAAGDPDRAVAVLLERRVQNPGMNFVVGFAHARAGRRREAAEVLEFLLDRRQREYVPATMIAIVYGALGERDRGIEWLERAIDERSLLVDELAVSALYDPLRGDPRFGVLLERVGLAGVAPAAGGR